MPPTDASQDPLAPDDAVWRQTMLDDAGKEGIDVLAAAKALGLSSIDQMTTKQLEDACLNAALKPESQQQNAPAADVSADPTGKSAAPVPKGLSIEEQLAEVKKMHAQQMTAMEARLTEALRARPATAAPAGTLVSPGLHANDADERDALFRQAEEYGLQFHQSASTAGMRDNINRHITGLIQARLAQEELDKEKRQKGPDRMVEVRVLPLGNNKISKGFHIPGRGDATYGRGEKFTIEYSIAAAQEAAGHVEITGEAPNAA